MRFVTFLPPKRIVNNYSEFVKSINLIFPYELQYSTQY